jgi:glycosyltransferase involved in cell wall biosynthesis
MKCNLGTASKRGAVLNAREFPLPPAGSPHQWPWVTDKESTLILSRPVSSELPRITIVTPSLNQGQYIEETIRSVLLQGYPNLEYFVIDGGSTDATIEIIKKYEPWISYWVSEPDKGQSDAINKGLRRATGDWVAWLNSDDQLTEDALRTVLPIMIDGSCEWIVGSTQIINEDSNGYADIVLPTLAGYSDLVAANYALPQASSFWKRDLHQRVGFLREDLHYSFDHELWTRFYRAGYRPYLESKILSVFRYHDTSKTVAGPHHFLLERRRLLDDLEKSQNEGDRSAVTTSKKILNGHLKHEATRLARLGCNPHLGRQERMKCLKEAFSASVLFTVKALLGVLFRRGKSIVFELGSSRKE